MRSETSLQKHEQALKDASVLAKFANLEPPGVESFRADHRDFVPQVCWTGQSVYAPNLPISWMQERNLLREAWAAGFPTEKTLELITTNLFLVAKIHASRSFMAQVEKNISKYIQMPDVTPPQKTWPYQDAVLFLHVNPTKAKICEWCGRRFISETKARFCSFSLVDVNGNETTCFWTHRKKYRHKNWDDNSDHINAKRRREYAAAKKKQKKAAR